ncbi:MAG: SpoIVB peptidase S55 domain-containing protein, partial [Armatimonadota bacterium]|nr:SpoIVB peptidase S55 domain-containing protein [Armatimonadota bacterium]
MPLSRFRGANKFVIITVIIACLTISAPVFAAYKLTPDDLKQLMPLKEVRPGMQGYGLTVFKGTTIEKFSVKVISILPKFNNGGSLILIRMGGGPITQRGANIIGGMSGSPVYINGKIIGAVSYGVMFPKEPLGLVTPIEDMLEVWDPNLPTRPTGLSSFPNELDRPVSIGGRSINRVLIQEPNAQPIIGAAGALVIRPLMTPVQVSGVSVHGIERLNELLAPYRMVAAPGPGSMQMKNKSKVTLQPGSSVGVALATGDVDMTFIGTLTYRKGNNVVGFGHKALAIGALDAPMTTAYVHDIMPGLMSSEKIASPLETVGRMSQDRWFSIGGAVGSMPKMIPVTISVNDLTAKRSKTFNIKVLNHPLLSTALITLAAGESVAQIHGAPGDSTAKITFEVDADEVGKIRKENVVFDPISIDGAALSDLTELLITLRQNRFYPLDVKSVKLWVNIVDKRNTAWIDRIFVKEGKYEPGETIDVGVVLKPYKGERVTTHVKVTIPPSTPSGRATLTVRGGSMHGPSMMAKADQVIEEDEEGPPTSAPMPSSDMAAADNMRQVIEKYLERDKNSDLVAKLTLSSSAVNVLGEKLSFLPPHLVTVMKSSRSTATRTEREDVKSVLPTEYVITGMQALPITIQKKEMSEKKLPAKRDDASESRSEESSSGPSTGGFGPGSGSMMDDGDFFGDSVESESTAAPGTPQPGIMFKPTPEMLKAHEKFLASRAAAQGQIKPRISSAGSQVSSKPDEKPIGRAASSWVQTTQQDFSAGLLVGAGATTANDVRLSETLEPFADTTESYLWTIMPDGQGGVYAGTGNGGTVIHVTADGKSKILFDSPELEVLSLAKDGAGNIYAGTSPNGIVYKIAPDGKATKLFDAAEKHISALVVDASGAVYAAVGDKSQVYKIDAQGSSKLFFSSPDQHAQALAIDSQGNLYIGTGTNGIVYKVTADGQSSVLYDAAESSITALAVDGKGNVYASANSKPVVIRIPVSGAPKVVLDKASSAIMSLAIDSSGNVLAESQDKIYRIESEDIVTEIDTKDDLQFVSMALDASGKLFVGLANPGSIYTNGSKPAMVGTYESVAHDTKVTSQWGVISWNAKTPEGAKVSISVRSGNSADPDGSWSGWSAVFGDPGGSHISAPPARYIQYRAELSSEKPGVTPELKDVTVVYMPENQAPTIKIAAPVGGEKWSKKQTVKWSGADPDKDILTYDIYYQADASFLWRPLKTGAKSVAPAPKQHAGQAEKEDAKSDEEKSSSDQEEEESVEDEDEGDVEVTEETIEEIISDLDRSQDAPRDVINKLPVEVPSAKQAKEVEPDKKDKAANGASADTENPDKASTKAIAPKSESTKDTSYSWDTKNVPDGIYKIKVVTSDKTSNATGSHSVEKISESFVIVNKAPTLVLFEKTMIVAPNRSVKLTGMATQKLVGITHTQYRVDSGDWLAVAADDGIFDSGMEQFSLTTQPILPKGEHV